MLNLVDEPEAIVREVSNLVENFVTNLKRGKLGGYRSESLSTNAAVEMAELMADIVRLFQANEEKPDSLTVQMLRANCPAMEVATMQVRRLLFLIGRTGDALLRSQFATLLLMNVTRRVLSIVRESAATNRATAKELEEEAKEMLNELGSEEDTGSDANSGSGCSCNNSITGSPNNNSTAMKKGMPLAGRQGLMVRFAESQPLLAEGVGVGGGTRHGGRNLELAASVNDFAASPLLHRAGSIVATDIPGQQLLKRAPSKRNEVQEDLEGVEFPVRAHSFYQDALEGIEELKSEIEGMTEELCKRAPRQLHSSDTVLTMGCSNTTYRYLLQAAMAGHSFKVAILEGAPSPSEPVRVLSQALRELGIAVQVLPDSSSFAVMSICTKVLIGVEAVLANGGLLAPIGTHMVCIAAKHFAVPTLCVTTTLKMSPYYPSDRLCTRLVRIARSGAQEMPWSTYGSPEDVLPSPYGCMSILDGGRSFTVHSPVTEYVPPELITLYATNDAEFTPSQVHRFVRANYSDAD